MTPESPLVKRTARAILLDGDPGTGAAAPPRLVLIKRTKPGRDPYWITPGGGFEPGVDRTVTEALHRELDEELGAEVTQVVPAFVDTVHNSPFPNDPRHGVKVQHFFVCRLAAMDPSRRHGPEVEEPAGEYEIVRVPFTRGGVTSVELVPPALRAFLHTNIEGVRALLEPDLS